MLERIFLDGTRRLRTVWRFAIYLIALAIAAVAVALAIPVLLVVAVLVVRQPLPGTEVALAAALLLSMFLFMLAAVLLITWLCRRRLDRRSLVSLGLAFRRGRSWRAAWQGLLVGAAAARCCRSAFYVRRGCFGSQRWSSRPTCRSWRRCWWSPLSARN